MGSLASAVRVAGIPAMSCAGALTVAEGGTSAMAESERTAVPTLPLRSSALAVKVSVVPAADCGTR